MAKINWNTIGKYAKKGCELAAYGAMTVLSFVSAKDVIDIIRYNGNVKYSDAFNEIMYSDMLSSYKEEVVAVLPKDGDSELYKAVIKTIKSDMLSSYKVKVIKNICESK